MGAITKCQFSRKMSIILLNDNLNFKEVNKYFNNKMSLVKNINNSRRAFHKSKSPEFSTVIQQHPMYDSNQMSWLDALVTALDNKSTTQGLTEQKLTRKNYNSSNQFISERQNQSYFKKTLKDKQSGVRQYSIKNSLVAEKENQQYTSKYNYSLRNGHQKQEYDSMKNSNDFKVCIRRNSAPVSDNNLNESIGKIRKNNNQIKKDSFDSKDYKTGQKNYLDEIHECCRDIKSSLTKKLDYPSYNLNNNFRQIPSRYSTNHYSIHQLRINKADSAKNEYFCKRNPQYSWDKYEKILPKNIILEQQIQSSLENQNKLQSFYLELFKTLDKQNYGTLYKNNCNTNQLCQQLKYLFGSVFNEIKNSQKQLGFDQFTRQCSKVTKNLDEMQLKSLLQNNFKRPFCLETKRSFESSQTQKQKKSAYLDSRVVRKFQFDFETTHQPLRKNPYIQQPSIVNTPPRTKNYVQQQNKLNRNVQKIENKNLLKNLSKSPYLVTQQYKLGQSPQNQLKKTSIEAINKPLSGQNQINKCKGLQQPQTNKKQKSLNALNQRLDKYINSLQRDYVIRMQDKLNFKELMKNLPKT